MIAELRPERPLFLRGFSTAVRARTAVFSFPNMSLADFDRADGREGFLYELNKGVVEVSDVPHQSHFFQLQSVRDQLVFFRLTVPGVIHSIAGSQDHKIPLEVDQSERHPDLSIYLTPPWPGIKQIWATWFAAIVIEVVSKSSSYRDYQEKPANYAAFGIAEYWVIDSFKERMTAMTRWAGSWKPKVLKPTQKYTTPLLPEFALDLKAVFDAGK